MSNAGRPPLYKDPKEMQERINEYFLQEDEEPTITGLCLHLGFESRQSFYDYQEKPEFAYTIKRARLMIENEYEKAGLKAKSPTFHIFALKNLGWSDKMEVDQKTEFSGSLETKTTISFTKGSKK